MTDEGSPQVREYMSVDVETVAPEDAVGDVAGRMADGDYGGFPVVDDRQVVGFVSARDLLPAGDGDRIADAMSEDLLVATPDMAVQDAARVILRSGIQKLPVVDDEGHLLGIVANADVIRSQIERATPDKVENLSRTLSAIHDVGTRIERREIGLDELTPSQATVYGDELEGRMYEMERGLAEPLVAVDNRGRWSPGQSTVQAFGDGDHDETAPPEPDDPLVLADGHHRATAAQRLGIDEMDAYVIVLEERVDLGMARTADQEQLESMDDVTVEDHARHPLIERTERLRDDEE